MNILEAFGRNCHTAFQKGLIFVPFSQWNMGVFISLFLTIT